jgi:hypothetical protein
MNPRLKRVAGFHERRAFNKTSAGIGSVSGKLAYVKPLSIGTAASFPPNPGGFHPRAKAWEPGRLARGLNPTPPASVELELTEYQAALWRVF